MVSAMDQGGEMLSLLIAQCHYVFLYRDLFPGHQSAPSAATEPSNQTNTAESMTGATSLSLTWQQQRFPATSLPPRDRLSTPRSRLALQAKRPLQIPALERARRRRA